MNHLVLLGDSIFDNAAYVEGGPAVIDQVRQDLPTGWQTTLLAVDGNITSDVPRQLRRLPRDTTHLVMSVGGNDALGSLSRLETRATTVMAALDTLTAIQADFQASYQTLLIRLVALHKPLMVCTIYDRVPGLPDGLRTALGLFNDVILRAAIHHRIPVLDLRMICTEPADYSAQSPIEPSSQGGAKIAARLAGAVSGHDFAVTRCTVYW